MTTIPGFAAPISARVAVPTSAPAPADVQDSVGTPVLPLYKPSLPAAPPSGGRGLAIVCIDGLSYPSLQYALRSGYMPNLQRLIQQDGYHAQQFFPGLPCTTPASMEGFTRGANPIPAFHWFDKATDTMFNADSFTTFDKGFEAPSEAQGQPGLLSKGTVHDCLGSGGDPNAQLSVDVASIKASEGGTPALLPYLGGSIATYATHHPIQFAGSLVQTARDFARDFEDNRNLPLKDRLAKSGRDAGDSGMLADMGTSEVVADMKKGVPSTFIDLSTHDATSHEYGPFAPETMGALQRIDKNIGTLAAAANGPGHRPYELVFVSDHGQTPSLRFDQTYGETLQHMITRLAGGDRVVDGPSGSLDNIYFPNQPGQLQLSQIQARYPGMVDALVAHPGVGLVVARQDGDTVIMGKGGQVRIHGGQSYATGRDVLAGYGSPEATIVQQMQHVAQLPNAGDLVVFGRYDGAANPADQRVVDFEPERGGHGGLGGAQNQAIFIAGPQRTTSTGDVTNSSQMYWVLGSMLPVDGQPAA